MESITHAPGQNASTRKPRRTARSSSEPAPDQIRGFHYDPRQAALGRDYLRRRWLPREGPLFYAFIQVMRGHCYYNPQTGEIRESCYPKVETIAKECGVDPATIHRMIQRDKTTGEFISKHAEALKRFIKVQPRWLYDPRVGHKTQRSSVYLVALDDPPVPEDDPLVAAKEAELEVMLTMEHVRQQRQAESASAPEQERTDLQNASQYTLAKCESVMSRKMPDKTLPVTITINPYLERTFGGRSSVDWSRGKQEDEKKALVGGEPAAHSSGEPAETTSHSSQPHQLRPGKETKRQRTRPLAEAHPLVGAAIHRVLLDLGGSNPARGVQTILEALVEVAAPPERIHDLFALGQRRLEQQQELHSIPNPTGYLIGIMRNVAVDGLLKGWDVALMRAEDEEKHAQALRSRGRAEPEAQAPAAEAATAEAAAEAPDEMARQASEATSATTTTADDVESSLSETTAAIERENAEEQTQDGQSDEEREAEQRAACEETQRYASMPIDPHARQIWQSALERIRPKVSQSAYTTWFSATSGHAREGAKFIVRVGSSFSRQHLETRFYDLIEQAASDQIGTKTEVRFIVIPEQELEEG